MIHNNTVINWIRPSYDLMKQNGDLRKELSASTDNKLLNLHIFRSYESRIQ